jgi:hypothetical protein
MPEVDPIKYIEKMSGRNNDEAPRISLEKDVKEVKVPQQVTVLGTQSTSNINNMQQGSGMSDPSEYSSYENDLLNYGKNIFKDDTIETILDLLKDMRLTPGVAARLAELYIVNASQDNVFTWSNAWLLQRRANEFKLQLFELKNTLLGPDADSLLFGDFDLAVEALVARLEARNSRSFEGFERKASVSTISVAHNIEGSNLGEVTRKDERAGLSRLGKLNIFGRQL